jgi:hypothetical protein
MFGNAGSSGTGVPMTGSSPVAACGSSSKGVRDQVG